MPWPEPKPGQGQCWGPSQGMVGVRGKARAGQEPQFGARRGRGQGQRNITMFLPQTDFGSSSPREEASSVQNLMGMTPKRCLNMVLPMVGATEGCLHG